MIIYYHDPDSNFYPLDLFRHQGKLLVGSVPFWKRNRGTFLIPEWLKSIYAKTNIKGCCLYLKATAIFERKMPPRGEEEIFKDRNGSVVGFRLKKGPYPATSEEIPGRLEKIKKKSVVRVLNFNYLWEIIAKNGEIIAKDFVKSNYPKDIKKKTTILGKEIVIKKAVKIDPGVILDSRDGPVFIGRGAWLKGGSVIEGPAFIGPETVIEGAKVKGGTSIGRCCRIGGEVEASVILDYTNKSHAGFLGHSYLGSWINIGSLTANSDLKNNYHNVKVRYKDFEYDTGLLKLGCFIGDHTKTGIGTLIPTGCVIGSFANIYGGGMIGSFIPSFSWGTPGNYEVYDLNSAVETAKIVMARRGIRLTKGYEELITEVSKLEG